MFSSSATPQTTRSPRLRSLHSNRCHPERSEGSAFLFSPLRAPILNGYDSWSPLPLNIPTFKPSSLQTTDLDAASSISPLFATLTENTRVGVHLSIQILLFPHLRKNRGQGTLRSNSEGDSQSWLSLGFPTDHGARVTGHGTTSTVAPHPAKCQNHACYTLGIRRRHLGKHIRSYGV